MRDLDALKYAPADEVRIELNTGISPCIILPADGEGLAVDGFGGHGDLSHAENALDGAFLLFRDHNGYTVDGVHQGLCGSGDRNGVGTGNGGAVIQDKPFAP